jgi:hypothetical protein
MFENRALRGIYGRRKDELTGGWRKLYNKELHNLYSSPSNTRLIKSRTIIWAGHVACMACRACSKGEMKNAFNILVGKPKGKRPLGRPKRRWEDNIKMYLRETGFGLWTGFVWLRIGTGGGLL